MLDSKVISGNKLPRFVTMKSVALRLVNTGTWCYHRDGGDWSVDIKIEDKKIFTTSGVSSINGIELTPITEEAWRKCNGQYAPKYPEPLGSTINAIELSWLDGAAQDTSNDKNYKNLLIRRYVRKR